MQKTLFAKCMLSQYSLLAKKMDTTQLFSIAIVFLCWSCNGEKPLREVPTRTLKQNAKSLEYRNDAKLKLLNSLLESKTMGDAHKKKVKFAGKPSEKVKYAVWYSCDWINYPNVVHA